MPDTEELSKSKLRHYADILNPLFTPDEFNYSHRLLEFVCTLVRAAGLEDAGWDSYQESLAFLEDLKCLGSLDLPSDRFPDPNATRTRLYLIAYCHAIEMNMPYELIANLLRVRLGRKYVIQPFRHLEPVPKKGKKPTLNSSRRPLSPEAKIKEIERLSAEASLPEVGAALRGVYDSVIRNAVYHSDYVVHDGSMRLLSAYRASKTENIMTQKVSFEELMGVIDEAFAFFSALIILHNRACRSFRGFDKTMIPFDGYYKGLLEIIFKDQEMIGFRTYWPNQNVCLYSRAKEGCTAQNIVFEADGSINFMVGLFETNPGAFSPLVEKDCEPSYAEVPAALSRPYWPHDLRPYTLDSVATD